MIKVVGEVLFKLLIVQNCGHKLPPCFIPCRISPDSHNVVLHAHQDAQDAHDAPLVAPPPLVTSHSQLWQPCHWSGAFMGAIINSMSTTAFALSVAREAAVIVQSLGWAEVETAEQQ